MPVLFAAEWAADDEDRKAGMQEGLAALTPPVSACSQLCQREQLLPGPWPQKSQQFLHGTDITVCASPTSLAI